MSEGEYSYPASAIQRMRYEAAMRCNRAFWQGVACGTIATAAAFLMAFWP